MFSESLERKRYNSADLIQETYHELTDLITDAAWEAFFVKNKEEEKRNLLGFQLAIS